MTRTALDKELLQIRDDILRLASLVNQATQRAVDAFVTNDTSMAQEVIDNDDQIDGIHHGLEEAVVRTTALQQPLATDLRMLIAALLITNELERMGDHAEGIAQIVLRMEEAGHVDIPPTLSQMTEWVSKMIQSTVDAYLADSPKDAKAAAKLDDQLDVLYHEYFDIVVERMTSGQLNSERGTYLLWAGHNLERIGDRVTNICERIVYASTGKVGGLNPKPDED